MNQKVLIIGAGRIAGLNEIDPARKKPCTHLGAIREAGLEAVAVVDSDAARAEHFAQALGLPRHGTDLDAMLDELRPDIVTVAVPYRFQHDIVQRIAASPARPKKLLLEKPLADNLERAKAIMSACERAGISVLVNNEAAAPVYRQISDLLDGHFQNGVISASAWCSSGMHAIGIHMLGVLRLLFGDVAWVRGHAETEYVASLPFSNNFTPEDPRIHGMIAFTSGVTAFLTNSALTAYTYKELEVTCRSGKLRLSDNGNKLEVWDRATPGESSISYRLAEPRTIAPSPGTAFTAIAEILADPDPNAGQDLIGGRLALDTYALLDALIASARSGQDVALAH